MYSTFLDVKKERSDDTATVFQPDFSVLMGIWGKEGACDGRRHEIQITWTYPRNTLHYGNFNLIS